MPRSRPRKPRLSRMDAAVDAMVPLGFPVEKVKKHVKQLLRVYGGDSGWPFIEEYAYKELIDAILRDVEGNDEEQVGEGGNQSKEKPFEDESGAGTSSRVSESQQDEGPENKSPEHITGSSDAVSEPKCPEFVSTSSGINNGDERDTKKTLPERSPGHINETANVARKNREAPITHASICTTPSLQPTNGHPPHRHLHCYGWIESDDEDVDDFVVLKPAPGVLGANAAQPQEASKNVLDDGTKSQRKRRSRWDLRPDDP